MARSTTSDHTRCSAGSGRFRGADDGFTLLESVIALTLFVVVVTFGAVGIRDTLKLTGTTSSRITAVNIATQELERLRQATYTGHAPQLTPPAGSIPTGYSVTNTTGSCSSGAMPITVLVTWGDASRPVTYESELSC